MQLVWLNCKEDTSKATEQKPKLFFTYDLEENGDICIQKIQSSENPADLFTKALSTSTFEKFVRKIVIRRLRDLQ